MIFTNLLRDSEEQGPGFDYLPNSRDIGNVSVVSGRYYLVSFSLKTDLRIMPVLMQTLFDDGLSLSPINSTIINTTNVLSPYQTYYTSIGVWLYGGYCTTSNPNWGLISTFGACGYSSFACTIDEVQGSTSSPIVQSIAAKNSVGVLANTTAGNSTYMVGMSTVTDETYPVSLSPGWNMLSRCHMNNVVPNLFTGFSLSGNNTPLWSESYQGQYEKAIIACELRTL